MERFRSGSPEGIFDSVLPLSSHISSISSGTFQSYLGGEKERRIHISILDMLYLIYLLDVRVEMSGRQLDIQVWNSGERLGLKIKIRESSTYR